MVAIPTALIVLTLIAITTWDAYEEQKTDGAFPFSQFVLRMVLIAILGTLIIGTGAQW